MSEDLRGPAEARLLHVERALEQMGRDVRVNQRKLIALGQGIWAEWGAAGAITSTPTPTPTPTPTLAVCCSGISPGTTIPFTDSIWGSGTLTWNAGANVWFGWLTAAWPGVGACGACSTAILYILDASANLTIWWAYNNTSQCPVATTASGTLTLPSAPPGSGFQSITYYQPFGGTDYYCNTSPMTSITNMSTSTPETLLRTGHSSEVITLTFTGSTATNMTSDFSGICSCIPTTLTLVDSVYGNVTLTYNPILQSWVGCTTVSYPGTSFCAAGTIAIHYTLEGSVFAANWQMLVQWVGHVVSGHACPLPGTNCSTPLGGVSRQVSGTIVSCTGGANTFTFPASSNSPWPGTGGATLTVTF
jgi:hypothetical protein